MYLKLNAAHQIHRKEVKGVPCLVCACTQMSCSSQFVAECKHRQIKTSGINSQQGLAFRRHLGQYIQNYDRGRGKKCEIITSSRSAGWIITNGSLFEWFGKNWLDLSFSWKLCRLWVRFILLLWLSMRSSCSHQKSWMLWFFRPWNYFRVVDCRVELYFAIRTLI